MNILIAPDSFKGSLPAVRAAEIIADTIMRLDPAAHCLLLPQADGGEGTVDALFSALGGRLHLHEVPDPLGRPVQARWLQLPGGSALVEVSSCVGYTLLREEERDPRLLRSDGLGHLLAHLYERGFTRVYCGLGGTATNDAGYGMARALGAEISHGAVAPESVREALATVESVARPPDRDVLVVGLADVTNPLCGPGGASAVYGPQKGIPEIDILEWDIAVRHFAAVACRDVHAVDIDSAGMGAAGGLGFALACFAGADLQSGADFVRRYSGADAAMPQADLVITGEGRIDAQSSQGKVLGGLVGEATGLGLPVVAFCGTADGEVDALATRLGVKAVLPIMEAGMTLSQSMRDAERLLRSAVDRAWPRISALR